MSWDCPKDLVEDAYRRREPLTLTAAQVVDLVEDFPDEDYVMDEWITKLQALNVTELKIPVKARRAIEDALGLPERELWS